MNRQLPARAQHPRREMNTVYASEGAAFDWPEDIFITDEALENLKESAETGCVLCEFEELEDDE
jgi:hypothetical protein